MWAKNIVLAAAFLSSVTGYNLTVLHTNDVHSHVDDYWENDLLIGSVARRKTAIDRVRAARENVLLLDAGDQFQGTLWFYVYEGQAAAHFMNDLQYDAEAFGNHEFDRGSEILGKFLDTANHPLVACNIDASQDPYLAGKFVPYVILERSGRKIGIIGVTTPDTVTLASPSKETIFSDPFVAVPKAIEDIKAEDSSVNIFIVLGHYGYTHDLELAQAIPEIDVIVGGHSHSFLYSESETPSKEVPLGEYPTVVSHDNGDKTLVVQAFQYAKYLGDIDIEFDDEGKALSWDNNPIVISGNTTDTFEAIPADPVVQAEVELWGKNVSALTSEVLGTTMTYLMGDRTVCRITECNMGNLVADAYVHKVMKVKQNPDELTNACIIGGGGLRADLPVGDIVYGDALNVLPFQNTIVELVLNGTTLLETLEHGVSAVEDREGRFLQVAGIRYQFDLSKPVGSRVTHAEILCQTTEQCGGDRPTYHDVNPDFDYRIVTLGYTANGGDGYTMLASEPQTDFGFIDADVFIEYLQMFETVYTEEEGRVIDVTGNNQTEDWTSSTSNSNTTISARAEVDATTDATITCPMTTTDTGVENVWIVVIALACAVVGAGVGFLAGKTTGKKGYFASETKTDLQY
eukprot:CFRG2752T1